MQDYDDFMRQARGEAAPNFPRGKSSPDDEGELNIALAIHPGSKTVRIAFPKPVLWLGLALADVRHLIAGLEAKAKELEALEEASRGSDIQPPDDQTEESGDGDRIPLP